MEEEIIQELNSKIDPYELIRHIAYRPDTIVLTEDMISIFCPIDKVDNKGLCEIDKRNLKFSCKHCFKKGNLVELYMWSKRISVEKAVVELKHAFGIALESEMKNKESQGLKGTYYEKYERLKSEVKEVTDLKKEQMSQNSEWLQNTLGGKADVQQEVQPNIPQQQLYSKNHESGNQNKMLPEIEKFMFKIYSEDDFYLNMLECEYRSFQAAKKGVVNEMSNVFVSPYFFKSSSVKLFGNMMKNKIVWMWGTPYVIFQKYDALSYFSPFYAAKYSPFEQILYKGKDISLNEYVSTVKKDNFGDFKFNGMEQEYSVENNIVSSQEAFKDTIRFITNLNNRFKIEMKNIKVYTDSSFYYVTINPYLFEQQPDRLLYERYENLALELTSTIVNDKKIIEHTDYKSLNLNVYHPAYLWKNMNFNDSKGYMWMMPSEKFVDYTYDELEETVRKRCCSPVSDFAVVPPVRILSEIYSKITEEGNHNVAEKTTVIEETQAPEMKVNKKHEYKPVHSEVAPETAAAGGKSNFLKFFSNEEYFVNKSTIKSRGFNFFKKKIFSGNVYLDKMLNGGMQNFYSYFIASHNFVTQYTFLTRIMDSFFKLSPANFIITDNTSDYCGLAPKSENLKVLKADIKGNEDFVSELDNLKYSSLFFLHSLDFAMSHIDFLKGIVQPVLIYSNTSRYEEFEKVSFQMKKGIKFIEVISVDNKNYNSVLLYGANDKINVEKYDIPLMNKM
ncbi:hypothetical protein KAJ27_11895 [bacterium]|nr:hypothetical protein [bacterium]